MARCRSTLIELPEDGFSRSALRVLADGRKMSHRLMVTRADLRLRDASGSGRQTLSISGVQDKVGLKLVRGHLIPEETESRYILKPIPSIQCRLHKDIPANEHLTMQIASQIFDIPTAANACVVLNDGELAYLTRRFDYRNNLKCLQEDFCQVSGRTEETHGYNYKYNGSYEEMGALIQQSCAAHRVEMVKFFRLVLFNYLVGNGDAHMKNFSLMRTEAGDFVLTPAYDLLNTKLHFPNESAMALDLFKKGFYTESYLANGFYRRVDFEVFSQRLNIPPTRIAKELNAAVNALEAIKQLVKRSFLSEAAQQAYLAVVMDRIRALS